MKNSVDIPVPKVVLEIIRKLEAHGFEAYAVGGCIRDSLLGREPEDWDIATSALPEQTMECFQEERVIPTGLAHGTVGLFLKGNVYEITTFRVDGDYADHRRPDQVEFTSRLEEDLARRDFTINALAYSPRTGLVDGFGGIQDLQRRTIRCVGEPGRRFEEDALRILRAARFASVLDFEILLETGSAMLRAKETLRYVSNERIAAELKKALLGRAFRKVFAHRAYADVLVEILPELAEMCALPIMWQTALDAVDCAPLEIAVRLAILLHSSSQAHEPKQNAEAAVAALKRLRFDRSTIKRVEVLVCYHRVCVGHGLQEVKHWLNRLGSEALNQLLCLQLALCNAGSVDYDCIDLEKALETLRNVLEEDQCWSLAQLQLKGNDLLELGFPAGRKIGAVLNILLSSVIRGDLPNNRTALLSEAERLRQNSANL